MAIVVPDSPEEFFSKFIPGRFNELKAALAGKTSAGSICFRVTDVGEWSYALENGELGVGTQMRDDAIVQVTVSKEDFGHVFVQAAQQQGDAPLKADNQVMAFKAVTIDAERAKLVRGIQGTVVFAILDGGSTRKLAITPGTASPKIDAPDCKLEVAMSDFIDLQMGKAQPLQMAMSGKMKIIGNAQIPMALSGVFA